ncbi:hypothetical protein BDV93DRAFT_525562, partial [Ceratobasidium sp. AG-I]
MAPTYPPPELPTYLSNTFHLKPVVGIPNDDEVKLIHSVIRAVENASHIPALCNPPLSMDLAHHLFEVQMARYKSKYTFPIFSDITYTPPELPSHMSISLEPVIIAPSDNQIRSAQAAFRFAEGMASVPSMYDADLSMQISQHLFDLQLARYIKRTNETHYAIHDEIASAEPGKKPSAKRPRVPIDSTFDTEQAVFEAGGSKLADGSDHETSSDGQTARPSSLDPPSATTELLAGVNGIIEQLKVNQDQVDQQLAGMQDKLKDGMKDALEVAAEKITRMMIKLRNHDARGLNAGNDYVYQHIVTEDGEAPT